MNAKIVLLPGDGIGPEVTAEAEKLLYTVAGALGASFEIQSALIGGAAIDAAGDPLPDATLAACRQALLESDVIGVDLERHCLRSYRGFTCLLQLATAACGGCAFLVDCLRLPWDNPCLFGKMKIGTDASFLLWSDQMKDNMLYGSFKIWPARPYIIYAFYLDGIVSDT